MIHKIACVRKFPCDLAGVVDPEIVVHRQADRLPAREEVVGRVEITNHHGLRWQVFADPVDHAVVLSPKRDVAPAHGARVEADVDGERGEGQGDGQRDSRDPAHACRQPLLDRATGPGDEQADQERAQCDRLAASIRVRHDENTEEVRGTVYPPQSD